MKQNTLLSACQRAGICLILLLSAQMSFGQTVKTIKLDFKEKDFTYNYDQDGCLTISCQKSAFRYGENSDEPSLPIKTIRVLIGPNQEFSSVSYIGDVREVKTNVRMLPNPYVVTTDDTIVYSGHRNTDYQKDIYPITCAEYAGTGIMDGYHIVSFIVCPFQYDSRSKTLRFIDNFSLNIVLTTAKDNRSSKLLTGDLMEDVVRRSVVNGTELDELYAHQRALARVQSLRSGNAPIDYLIITNDTLAPAFAPLVNWKKQKGIRTEVRTVNSIFTEYSNSSWRNQIKIKHCIEDYKNLKHTRFVLLGGDVEIVPEQKCYVQSSFYGEGVVKDSVEADVFYASFDNNFGWNADGDSIIGEKNDSIDMLPDIYLTRASVSTTSDVNAFVTKTINYEKNPPVDTWKNRVLMAGGKLLFTYTINGREMTDLEYESDMVYSGFFLNKWNGLRTKYFTTWSSLINGPTILNPSEFHSLLQDGYSIIDVNGHGSILGWNAASGSNSMIYTQEMADTLVSAQPSIIMTESCFTNHFATLPEFFCLSEKFLRNPNSGVVGYFGSSHYGVGSYSPTPPSNINYCGSSAILNSKFYDNLFANTEETKNFGKIALLAKHDLGAPNLYNSYRWLHFAVNPMGDCEMPVYTSTPKVMSNVHLTFSNNSLSVNTGMTGCRICVMDLDDDEGYYQVADSIQTATFVSLPERYSLCITKQDYIPFIKELYRNPDSSGTYYIQNETIEEDRTYNVTSMQIGSNVTMDKPNGAVTVEDGNTVINASGTVFIKNNFEVKQGAEFSIE